MRAQEGQEKHDKFLMSVLSNSLIAIFFIVGAGVVASVNWAAGVASAAGSLAVAYVAKLVIQSRGD